MATIDTENERKYLTKLIETGDKGQQAWAKQEIGKYEPGGTVMMGSTGTKAKTMNTPKTTQPKTLKSTEDDYYKQLAEQQRKAQIAKLENAYKADLSGLEQERTKIQPKYYEQRDIASTQSQLGARNLAEYIAQRGQTNTGYATAQEVNRQMNLGSTLGQLGKAEAESFADIERRKQQLGQAYQSDLASAEAGIQSQLLQNLINQRQQDIQNQAQYLGTYGGQATMQGQQLQQQLRQAELERQLGTIGAYGQDFQAEINRRLATPDTADDELIPYLQSARNQKISGIQQSQAEQQAQAQDYYLNLLKITGYATPEISQALGIPQGTTTLDYVNTMYDVNKPYFKPTATRTSGGSGGSGSGGSASTYIKRNTAIEKLIDSAYTSKNEFGEEVLDTKKASAYLDNQLNAGTLNKATYDYYKELYGIQDASGGGYYDAIAEQVRTVTGTGQGYDTALDNLRSFKNEIIKEQGQQAYDNLNRQLTLSLGGSLIGR